MPSIPETKAKNLHKILIKLGFKFREGEGSHRVYTHQDGRRTVISMHSKPLGKGLLKTILRQIQLTTNEFLDLS